MSTFKQPVPDDGLRTGDQEDEIKSSDHAINTSLQFPFFDNEEQLDLSVSRSFIQDRVFRSPHAARMTPNEAKQSAAATSFPSELGMADFAMELSPIARSRGSDVSEEGGHIFHANSAFSGNEKDHRSRGKTPTAIAEPFSSTMSQEHTNAERLSNSSESSTSSVLDDLQSARKQVGQSSINFIDKIRNAAHKRKVAVTRSRDSLVAKEQEQLRSIAQSKARSESLLDSTNNIQRKDDTENVCPHHEINRSEPFSMNPFRSKYRRNMDGGFGGVGVPKVNKRPTTTPFSPLLGSRRREKSIVKALQTLKQSTTNETSNKTVRPRSSSSISGNQKNAFFSGTQGLYDRTVASRLVSARIKGPEQLNVHNRMPPESSFKARPLPSSNGRTGHAGQAGVPKVPKRKVTVPVSPSLGPKRNSKNIMMDKPKVIRGEIERIVESRVARDPRSRASPESFTSIQSIRKTVSTSTAESSELLGLNLLDVTPDEKGGKLAKGEELNSTPPTTSAKPFEPRSTCRANKRAEYDAIRDQNRQQRRLEEQQRLKNQIKLIHKELAAMSKGLT